MGGKENEEQAKATHQVGVVYVLTFIEKEEIAAAEKKKHSADAIEKSGRYKSRQNAEHGPMSVKSIAGPGMNPGKSVVLEQKPRLNPIGGDLVTHHDNIGHHH